MSAITLGPSCSKLGDVVCETANDHHHIRAQAIRSTFSMALLCGIAQNEDFVSVIQGISSDEIKMDSLNL